MQLGLIGLGRMGSGMARRLMQGGHKLVVYDRSPQAVAALAYAIHYLPAPPFRVVSGSGARYPVSAAIIAIVTGALVRNILPLPAAAIESAKRQARRSTNADDRSRR